MEYKPILTIAESEKATVEMASMKGHSGPVVVKRLKEANPDIYRLLCHAQNPHIPEIYEVETDGTDVLVVEEHVDGVNLEEYLEKQTLSDDAKLKLALQLCEAVEFLHGMEPPIIHRDIKPSNILINGKGVLKLIDFDASRNYKANQSSGDTRLLGTVEYAPPEQFGYSQTDVRSDIYSMGVVFHEMQLKEDEKRIAEWTKLVDTCTNFDPKNRFQSVAELKKEIEKLIAWKKEQRKKLAVRISLIMLAVFVAGVSIHIIRTAMEKKAAQNIAQNAMLNEVQNAEKNQKEVQDAEQNQPVEQKQESGLIEQTGEFYYEYPQDVTATLNSAASGQINALYLRYTTRPENPELQRLQAWCYEIAEDGTSIRIKKEYLSEIRKDIGQLNLVVACDDGNLYELFIHILAGLPEGVPVGTVAEEIMPVEIPESRTELYPNLEKAPETIWYSYYKSARTEFVIPDDKYRAYEVFDYATCYCYQTGLAIDIPYEMLTLEDGYVVVAQQFMMSLEPYVYEFCFYYNNSRRNESSVVETTFKVYPEETEVLSAGFLLLKSEQTVYTRISGMVTNVVRNGKRSRIDACYVLNQYGEKEYLGGRNEFGRICWVPNAQLMPYFEQGTVTLYIRFDTGEISEMTIKLVEGMPEWLQSQKTLDEIKASLQRCLTYYKSVSAKSSVIFSHYGEQMQLERVLCYNYITGERWEVPVDMTGTGPGYFSVSGDYVHTLEPEIYRFTFVTPNFDAELNVHVCSETVLPTAVDTGSRFFDAPILGESGVAVVLRFEVPCNLTGVSIVRAGKEIPIEPEGYHMACNGRYVLVKREVLMQYADEGSVMLVYQFDDGSQQQEEIKLVGNLADKGIPAFSSSPTPTVMPTMPETINQHYYKGFAEDTELVFRNGSENFNGNSVRWTGECYNYVTGETIKIPEDMIEVSEWYTRFEDEFLLSLESAVYKFIVELRSENGNGQQTITRTVEIHSEEEVLLSHNRPMAKSLERFDAMNPFDAPFSVFSDSTSRFTGISFQRIGGTEETIDSKWYDIYCDGKIAVLRKEFLMQYCDEGMVELIFYFDDGKQADVTVTYE